MRSDRRQARPRALALGPGPIEEKWNVPVLRDADCTASVSDARHAACQNNLNTKRHLAFKRPLFLCSEMCSSYWSTTRERYHYLLSSTALLGGVLFVKVDWFCFKNTANVIAVMNDELTKICRATVHFQFYSLFNMYEYVL